MKKYILTLFLFLWGSAPVFSQTVLAGWDMKGLTNYGTSPFSPVLSSPDVIAGGLVRGGGITVSGTGAADAWGGTGLNEISFADAISDNDFITFTIEANAGFEVSLTEIEAYNIRRSASGATEGQWQYRVGAGGFVNIGLPVTWGMNTTTAGNTQPAIDLSGIPGLQNTVAGTLITIRLVLWGGSAASGTWYFNNFQLGEDLVIKGTVTNVSSVTLTTGVVSGAPFNMNNCSSTQPGSVIYALSGTFNAGNEFRAELSDATGSFVNALLIGSIASTSAGSVNFTVPENLPAGSGYKIRVVSTHPAFTGTQSAAFMLTQNGEYCPQTGDYRTRSNGNWDDSDNWQVYTYNPNIKTRAWEDCTGGDYPQDASASVFIRTNHTSVLNVSSLPLKNLIVEAGGKFYRNSNSSTHFINLCGDIFCNGTIGNGAVSDALGFNIQAGNHIVKGSGTFDCWRIRLSNETTGGAIAGSAVLTLDMDVTLWWAGGSNAVYNARQAAADFDVIINAGKTLRVTNSTTSIGMDGIGASYAAQERGGGYTVFGTIDCAGFYRAGSDNSTSKPYFTVKNGGVAKFAYIDFGSDNVLSGGEITVETDGELEITGANDNNNTWVNTTSGSIDFDIETGGEIAYTGNGTQNITGVFDYAVLEINKSSGGLVLTSNLTVKEELKMLSGEIQTNSHTLTVGASVSEKGQISYTSGFVNGTLRRWFDGINSGAESGLFPIGTEAEKKFVTIAFTTAPAAGGTLTVSLQESYMGNNGLPLTVPATGSCPAFDITSASYQAYWRIDDGEGLSGGAYSITLEAEGFNTVTDLCEMAILKRTGTGGWQLAGTHVEATGSLSVPVLKAVDCTGWSNFGLGGGSLNPLHVNFLTFTATPKTESRTVLLTWQTAQEENNSHFEILRSGESEKWEKAGIVQGAGTSYELNEYAFTDYSPNTVNYYRLRQVDYDGKETLSPVRFVHFPLPAFGEGAGVKVFPNPSQGIVHIKAKSRFEYSVYDVHGRLIKQGHSTSYTSIENLANGLYFIRLQTENRVKVAKVVVE